MKNNHDQSLYIYIQSPLKKDPLNADPLSLPFLHNQKDDYKIEEALHTNILFFLVHFQGNHPLLHTSDTFHQSVSLSSLTSINLIDCTLVNII